PGGPWHRPMYRWRRQASANSMKRRCSLVTKNGSGAVSTSSARSSPSAVKLSTASRARSYRSSSIGRLLLPVALEGGRCRVLRRREDGHRDHCARLLVDGEEAIHEVGSLADGAGKLAAASVPGGGDVLQRDCLGGQLGADRPREEA